MAFCVIYTVKATHYISGDLPQKTYGGLLSSKQIISLVLYMSCLDHLKNHDQKLIKLIPFTFLLMCKLFWTDNACTIEYSLVWSYDHLIISKKGLKRTLAGIIVRRYYIFFTWPDQSTFLYQWSLFKRHNAIMIIHYKQNKQDVRLEIKYWQRSGKFAEDERELSLGSSVFLHAKTNSIISLSILDRSLTFSFFF